MWNNTDEVNSILLKQEKFHDLSFYSTTHTDNIITPKNLVMNRKHHVITISFTSQYIWRYVVLLIHFCLLWHGSNTHFHSNLKPVFHLYVELSSFDLKKQELTSSV